MNIHEIVNSTRNYNLHSHTQFCDGRFTMEEMVKAAIDCGMEHYGFTPHSPIPIPSSCNMSALSVDDYMAEFSRLKEMYGDRIHLYMSMEIDYLGERWGATNPYFERLPLDYRLSSVHFVTSADGRKEVDVDGQPAHFKENLDRYFDGDLRYVVDRFYARTLEMIEKGGFDMLGHFDKIGSNASAVRPGIEDEPWYRRHIDNVIDAILARPSLIVEVNTKAYSPPARADNSVAAAYRPRIYPSPETIKRLLSAGVTLAVNSDSHYTSRITTGRSEAFDIIDRLAL
ncbi:MAG: histidinol-phosphatase [Bacteroides sp.]|nr:histidinol-phosphatase [Bacteroides sp.]